MDSIVAQLGRVKAAGLPVREEMGIDCRHANQDKFWVEDPDGVEWEVYHLNYDLEGEGQLSPAAGKIPLVTPGDTGCRRLELLRRELCGST